MGDVFPGKTRGPRAEKQPYVPDPLPKGVQSMGDFLPGMTKPARPVRKRQEPGRWDGVGEKPSPKPCHGAVHGGRGREGGRPADHPQRGMQGISRGV